MAVIERELTAGDFPDSEPDGAQPIRWTVEQYHRMSEAGLFEDLRVELIEGEIIVMPAIGSFHFAAVVRTTRTLWNVFGIQYLVVPQNGFRANPRSEPQPDVAVYAASDTDYREALPTEALLVVEVSDSTLRTDRTKKARLYASAGVQEYWIVNLRDEVLEVYRQPVTDANSPVAYQSVLTLRSTDSVTPLAAPNATIGVADLLP